MSLKNEKCKNKLESGRQKKFGKEFAEIPKGKHYVEELEPLIGAAVDLECDDWVFIPGELGGMPCEKLLLKSVKLVKCPASRGVEKFSRRILVICPLSSRQVKYLKVSDKNTYISFWSVGIFMHTISLYIF